MALFGRKTVKKEEEKKDETPDVKDVAVSEPESVKEKEDKKEGKKKEDKKLSVTKDLEIAENVRANNLSGNLLRPRITEKASLAMERKVYVFDILPRATKKDVIESVKKFYKVTPAKVNIVKIPSKKRESQMRRTRGVKAGGKKAYVYLKEGDSMDVI